MVVPVERGYPYARGRGFDELDLDWMDREFGTAVTRRAGVVVGDSEATRAPPWSELVGIEAWGGDGGPRTLAAGVPAADAGGSSGGWWNPTLGALGLGRSKKHRMIFFIETLLTWRWQRGNIPGPVG
jgi:hypothetical protein